MTKIWNEGRCPVGIFLRSSPDPPEVVKNFCPVTSQGGVGRNKKSGDQRDEPASVGAWVVVREVERGTMGGENPREDKTKKKGM